MSTQHGNAKHQAAVTKTAEKVQRLRVDIHTQLAVVRRLHKQLEDLADTRQSVGMPFQTPAARENAGKQALLDRIAARTPNSVPPSGPIAAPVTMPAVSASADIKAELWQMVARIVRRGALLVVLEAEQTEQEDHGLCTWPRRPLTATPPATDGNVDQLAGHLGRLIDGYSNRTGLQDVLRRLERLEDIARTVLDGVPAKEPAPRPTCPWCGRDTLALVHREKRDDETGIHAVEIIRCEGDHECHCTRSMCPCHPPRSNRHEWHRATGAADTWTQLASLQNKHQELIAMETKAQDALDRVRQLHFETPLQPWAADCPTPAEHQHIALSEQNVICGDCPPLAQVCAHCADLTEDEIATWPCPTIRAIDPDLDQPIDSNRSNH